MIEKSLKKLLSATAQGKRFMSVALNIGDRVSIQASPGAKSIIAFSDQKTIGEQT